MESEEWVIMRRYRHPGSLLFVYYVIVNAEKTGEIEVRKVQTGFTATRRKKPFNSFFPLTSFYYLIFLQWSPNY